MKALLTIAFLVISSPTLAETVPTTCGAQMEARKIVAREAYFFLVKCQQDAEKTCKTKKGNFDKCVADLVGRAPLPIAR